MGDTTLRLVFYLIACLGVGMVVGASRASSLPGVTRESLKSFVSLAGGIALLCVALQLVQAIVQP